MDPHITALDSTLILLVLLCTYKAFATGVESSLSSASTEGLSLTSPGNATPSLTFRSGEASATSAEFTANHHRSMPYTGSSIMAVTYRVSESGTSESNHLRENSGRTTTPFQSLSTDSNLAPVSDSPALMSVENGFAEGENERSTSCSSLEQCFPQTSHDNLPTENVLVTSLTTMRRHSDLTEPYEMASSFTDIYSTTATSLAYSYRGIDPETQMPIFRSGTATDVTGKYSDHDHGTSTLIEEHLPSISTLSSLTPNTQRMTMTTMTSPNIAPSPSVLDQSSELSRFSSELSSSYQRASLQSASSPDNAGDSVTETAPGLSTTVQDKYSSRSHASDTTAPLTTHERSVKETEAAGELSSSLSMPVVISLSTYSNTTTDSPINSLPFSETIVVGTPVSFIIESSSFSEAITEATESTVIVSSQDVSADASAYTGGSSAETPHLHSVSFTAYMSTAIDCTDCPSPRPTITTAMISTMAVEKIPCGENESCVYEPTNVPQLQTSLSHISNFASPSSVGSESRTPDLETSPISSAKLSREIRTHTPWPSSQQASVPEDFSTSIFTSATCCSSPVTIQDASLFSSTRPESSARALSLTTPPLSAYTYSSDNSFMTPATELSSSENGEVQPTSTLYVSASQAVTVTASSPHPDQEFFVIFFFDGECKSLITHSRERQLLANELSRDIANVSGIDLDAGTVGAGEIYCEPNFIVVRFSHADKLSVTSALYKTFRAQAVQIHLNTCPQGRQSCFLSFTKFEVHDSLLDIPQKDISENKVAETAVTAIAVCICLILLTVGGVVFAKEIYFRRKRKSLRFISDKDIAVSKKETVALRSLPAQTPIYSTVEMTEVDEETAYAEHCHSGGNVNPGFSVSHTKVDSYSGKSSRIRNSQKEDSPLPSRSHDTPVPPKSDSYGLVVGLLGYNKRLNDQLNHYAVPNKRTNKIADDGNSSNARSQQQRESQGVPMTSTSPSNPDGDDSPIVPARHLRRAVTPSGMSRSGSTDNLLQQTQGGEQEQSQKGSENPSFTSTATTTSTNTFTATKDSAKSLFI